MWCLMLIIIYCTPLYADIEQYTALSSTDWENWIHLKTSDITKFAVDDISDNLIRICASVIPQPNIPDDPRNKYIDGKMYTDT